MSEVSNDQTVTRRSFIRNLTLSAMAAAAVGSGAAILTKKQQSTPMPVAIAEMPAIPTSIPAVQSAQNFVSAQNDATELIARLAQAQAENLRLQSALDAAQRELAGIRPALNNENSANEALSVQLAQSQEKIGVLSGLVALYKQLDDVDVVDTVQNGMAIVSESIGELLAQTPTLSQGIEFGHQALAEVENHLPLLENGRLWLDAQANKMGAFYETVEIVLQNVMESFGSFLEMVEEWFTGIRKWLPFGIGEKAAEVIGAISTLVAETPHTISGLDTYLAQPLDVWLSRENDQPRIKQTLINPLRDQLLTEANETINRAQKVQTAYQDQLTFPVQGKVISHQAIRQQIESYRQQYQV